MKKNDLDAKQTKIQSLQFQRKTLIDAIEKLASSPDGKTDFTFSGCIFIENIQYLTEQGFDVVILNSNSESEFGAIPTYKISISDKISIDEDLKAAEFKRIALPKQRDYIVQLMHNENFARTGCATFYGDIYWEIIELLTAKGYLLTECAPIDYTRVTLITIDPNITLSKTELRKSEKIANDKIKEIAKSEHEYCADFLNFLNYDSNS